MADHKDYYTGSSWTDPKAWDALVEIARALVRCADQLDGKGCDYASLYVSSWPPNDNQEMRHVSATFSLPSAMIDAAMTKAGITDEGPLARDQAIRASLIELE